MQIQLLRGQLMQEDWFVAIKIKYMESPITTTISGWCVTTTVRARTPRSHVTMWYEIQCDVMWYMICHMTMWCDVMWYVVHWCGVVAVWFDTKQYMIWNDLIRFDTIRYMIYDKIWLDLIWCDMTWYVMMCMCVMRNVFHAPLIPFQIWI